MTGTRRGLAGIVALLAVCAVVALTGCAPARPAGTGEQPAAGEAGDFGGVETDVLMLGRSVMGGWFQHWGYDGTNPVERNGFRLLYREIEGPEGIGRSAVEAIEETPPGSTVFFKFCFVDFNSDDAELERNKGYVEQVVDAAAERGVRLIIGNALPKTKGETTRELVAEHRAYNGWLLSLVQGDDGSIGVFDMYDVLAGDDGALKPGYAQSRDDAHLTEAAYDALDEAFFDYLESE